MRVSGLRNNNIKRIKTTYNQCLRDLKEAGGNADGVCAIQYFDELTGGFIMVGK